MTRARDFADLAGSADAGGITGRSLVINGAMNVAQRSTSVTGLGDGDEGYVTLDRMRHTAAASAGRFTSAQTAVSDLPGFLNCLHLDCTTADTSIAATELLIIEQRLEGQDLQQLKKGTSSAEPVTVSFYMKTNKAFTFMCALNDFDNNRVNVQQFTTTTSWTRHSITFAGDTTGALGDDSGNSLSVEIYLHAGSNFTGGTYSANTWQSRASSDNMRAVGIGSFYDSTDNDVKLTGLQVEIGEKATPFEHRSFDDDLRRCHRYFHQFQKSSEGGEIIIAGATSGGTNFNAHMFMPMRAAPTVTFPTSASVRQGSSTFNVSSWSASTHHPNGTFNLQASMASSATANTASFAYSFQNDISFDAEL